MKASITCERNERICPEKMSTNVHSSSVAARDWDCNIVTRHELENGSHCSVSIQWNTTEQYQKNQTTDTTNGREESELHRAASEGRKPGIARWMSPDCISMNFKEKFI